MLIEHAHILPMEGAEIEDGYILIKNGLIEELGEMQQYSGGAEEETIDAAGRLVLPGFIDGHCHIGMWEDSVDFEGDDGNEDTDPLTPQLSALDAVNPTDRCFSEAYHAGVTTVVTGPGSANPIGGRWVAMKTFGRRIDDMLIANPVGMKFALGENPKNVYHGKNQAPVTRMATAALIREQLNKAKRYLADKERSVQEEDYDEPEYDAKCEAMIPVLQGKLKAFFHAHRADDVFTAVRIAKEFHLDYVLIHATEGYTVADLLAEEQAAIIGGPFLCDRSKPELKSLTPKAPGILAEYGLKTAVCTDHPVIPIQYLPLCASIAKEEGLERQAALEAITIVPAKLCGIDDKVGSIRRGKQADLCIFSRDPLGVCARPDIVIIDGKRVV